MRVKVGIVILLFLIGLVLISFFKKTETNSNLDYKLGIVANDGIAMVSISNERKMINILNLNSDVDVWVPGGKSWVNNLQIKKILEQEKNDGLKEQIFWYNFGFLTDKILFLDSVDDWENESVLINNWGFLNWMKYNMSRGKMLLKREKIEGKLEDNRLLLDEIMVRDFSETKLNNEELRLSVFNNTGQSGLAGFMSERMEWTGFSVVSADNNDEKIEKCLIIYGNKVDLTYGWKTINEVFDCEKKYDENLNENELQIYFGDKFTGMIQYPSYFR